MAIIDEIKALDDVKALKEVFWVNPKYGKSEIELIKISLGIDDVNEAESRLKRFAPYIAKVFPETAESADTVESAGIIESPLIEIPNMKKFLLGELQSSQMATSKLESSEIGKLYLKCDNYLPIAGSIKARGGIYTILKHAEELAIANSMLRLDEDYSKFANDEFHQFFSNYKISVGSTGNLGLSIGIISAKLGFGVTVHMSSDAKRWKKDLLRSKGVTVVEYESDYSKAVEEGRKLSNLDPKSFFIDDENSVDLFLGYAVANKRLEAQLMDFNILIDENNPLFLYLPCGVGGAPGGIAFGAKLLWGDNVHCFFAEPTHSPCMLVGMATGLHDKICVQDLGIDNVTDADGLAVGKPSGFIGKTLEYLISGIYTIEDQPLYDLLRKMADLENIWLEPSALAGVPGITRLLSSDSGKNYIKLHQLEAKMKNATHIAWATGGSLVPKDIMNSYYLKGEK